MVKVVKLFAGVLWKRCSDNFIGKHLCRILFFKKLSRLQAKETPAQHLFVTATAKYRFFLRYVGLSHKRRFLQPWLF